MKTVNGWTILKEEPHRFRPDVSVVLVVIDQGAALPRFATHLRQGDGKKLLFGNYFNNDIAAAVNDLYKRRDRRLTIRL